MQSFLPSPDCNSQTLKRFICEFTVALAHHFDFHGRIDPAGLDEHPPVRYGTPSEALVLVQGMDALSLFSIESRSFHLLIDLYEDGIELLFNALTPDAGACLADLKRLAARILGRLCP